MSRAYEKQYGKQQEMIETLLDNGAVIRVAIRVDRKMRTAEIDFAGTSAQLANNFNAPRAVCMAAASIFDP